MLERISNAVGIVVLAILLILLSGATVNISTLAGNFGSDYVAQFSR